MVDLPEVHVDLDLDLVDELWVVDLHVSSLSSYRYRYSTAGRMGFLAGPRSRNSYMLTLNQ